MTGASLGAFTKIRAALFADASRICELHLASVRSICAPYYQTSIIDGWLKGRVPQGYIRGIESGAMFVAEAETQTVGFGETVPGEVLAIFVDPAFSCRGVGSLLLRHALNRAKSGHPSAVQVKSTLNAVGFYERFGFRVVRPSYLRRNEVDVPVVIMETRES